MEGKNNPNSINGEEERGKMRMTWQLNYLPFAELTNELITAVGRVSPTPIDISQSGKIFIITFR